MFKAGIKPPRPRGPFSESRSVSVTLDAANEARGLKQLDAADGATIPAKAGGKSCRAAAPTQHTGQYFYFQVDDSFKWADQMLADVEVDYFDEGTGAFWVEYDGSDPNAPFNGAYTASKTAVALGNTGQWKTARFRLLEAKFLNSQNGGADFRINVQGDPVHFGKVTVSRLGMPAEAGANVRGWQQDFANPLGGDWIVNGRAGDFRQSDGVLTAGPLAEGPSLLLARPYVSDGEPVEVLTRARPVSSAPNPNWMGGLAVAVDSTSHQGFGALFRRDEIGGQSLGLIDSGDAFGPFVPAAWETNRWYWLRARHQTNGLTHYPDLWARLWPADGETSEPEAWTTWRDYFPTNTAIRGLAGIMAGQGLIEFDYFLVKHDALPEIAARLPPLKPMRARFDPVCFTAEEGIQFGLRGEARTSYLLERSADLAGWAGEVVTTDVSGFAPIRDGTATNDPHRFYRARTLP
jgi:hypothetical protein